MSEPPKDNYFPYEVGYRDGISQSTFKLALSIDCPLAVSFTNIDDWLKNAFGIPIIQQPVVACSVQTSSEARAVGLVWRIMNLGAALLQAVRIPTFDVGQITALRRNSALSSSWTLALSVPCMDYIQPELYTRAYQAAAGALKWLIGRAYTPTNLERLFSLLNDGFVQKFNAVAFGGESTIQVLQEAWKKGIEFRHLGRGTYQLGWGASQLRVARGAIQFDSAIGAEISADKWRAANLLRTAGLPAPIHQRATSEKAALSIAHELGWPVVIKPLDRDRGEGVTVNVRSEEQLTVAYQRAAALSKIVLVERQVLGVCHRVLVVNGRVWVVAKRLPKSVKGDGRNTVRELVKKSNDEEAARPPWSRLKPFPLDEMALSCLAAAGFTPDSVPPEGALAPLRPIQTSEWGGVVDDLTAQIHRENAAIAIKSARLFGLTVAGIDIISSDITRPWYENGAIINEVNFSPLLSGKAAGALIAAILGEWLPNNGRIPIEVVMGGPSAMAQALQLRRAYEARAIQCWLASHCNVLSADGKPAALLANGLFGRCLALLMDAEVEALVMVIQTDELLHTGLPMGRIDRLIEVPEVDSTSSGASTAAFDTLPWLAPMRKLLQAHLRPPNEIGFTELMPYSSTQPT